MSLKEDFRSKRNSNSEVTQADFDQFKAKYGDPEQFLHTLYTEDENGDPVQGDTVNAYRWKIETKTKKSIDIYILTILQTQIVG